MNQCLPYCYTSGCAQNGESRAGTGACSNALFGTEKGQKQTGGGRGGGREVRAKRLNGRVCWVTIPRTLQLGVLLFALGHVESAISRLPPS